MGLSGLHVRGKAQAPGKSKAGTRNTQPDEYVSNTLVTKGQLGQGGFSSVFRGTLRIGHESVAVAVKPDLSELELFVLQRLAKQDPASLRGVVPVLDATHRTARGDVALLGCGSLGTLDSALPRLSAVGALNTNLFLALVAAIAEGLDTMHQFELIHCDPKPDNLVLHADGPDVSLWLIDFGDARALDHPEWWWFTGPGAPEVSCQPDMWNGQLSARTDSWCLAQCAALLWSWAVGAWDWPENPAWLDAKMPLYHMLRSCLRKNPASRASVGDIAAAARRELATAGSDVRRELAEVVAQLRV